MFADGSLVGQRGHLFEGLSHLSASRIQSTKGRVQDKQAFIGMETTKMQEDLERQAKILKERNESQDAVQSTEGDFTTTQNPNTDPTKEEKKKPLSLRILRFALDQWFLLTLALLIAISSQVQVPKSHQRIKSIVVSYLCVSVIFFLTGCTLSTQTLIDNYSRWKLHIFVQVQCFFITSALMFAIVSAAATKKDFMDPGLLIGMILTGCVATTISSNVVMTGQAHGNQALTVVQSTIGNFLGPFLTPFLFKAYTSTGAWYTRVLPPEPGGYAELYRRVFKQLGLSVFIPMAIGQILHNLFPNATKTICTKYKVGKLGSVALLIIIWQTYDQAFSSDALRLIKPSNILFVLFMSIALFSLFLVVSFLTCRLWLGRADTVAICYCVPAKTPAMGVPLSTVLFVGMSPFLEAQLQLPLVMYQGLQILAGTALAVPFRRWVDSEDKN